MDMEGALRARLLAAPAITTLVGQRVYWDDRPQASVLPDITLQLIVDDRDQHMGGFQDMQSALLQLDARGRTFAEKKAIKEAIIATLAPAQSGNGISFRRATNIRAHPANERTETQFIFRDIIEMNIHHATA